MTTALRHTFAALALTLLMGLHAVEAEVVVVVSAKNPISVLTRSQLMDIFLGKRDIFPDGSRALPLDQSEGADERKEFYLKFANKTTAQIKAYWASIIFTGRGLPPQEVPSDMEVKRFLAANPSAIGYIDKSLVDSSIKMLQIR